MLLTIHANVPSQDINNCFDNRIPCQEYFDFQYLSKCMDCNELKSSVGNDITLQHSHCLLWVRKVIKRPAHYLLKVRIIPTLSEREQVFCSVNERNLKDLHN